MLNDGETGHDQYFMVLATDAQGPVEGWIFTLSYDNKSGYSIMMQNVFVFNDDTPPPPDSFNAIAGTYILKNSTDILISWLVYESSDGSNYYSTLYGQIWNISLS